MKTHLICLLSIAMLSHQLVATEPTTTIAEAQVAMPEPHIEVSRHYANIYEGFTFYVSFPVAMVEGEKVGQIAEEVPLQVSHKEYIQAKWQSESRLEVKFTRAMAPLEVFRVEIPAGTKGLRGEELSGCKKLLPSTRYGIHSMGVCNNGYLVLRAEEEDYVEILQQRVGKIYYERDGKRSELKSRPATVADALAHREAFASAYNYRIDDEGWKELEKHPADEMLEHTWVVEAPQICCEGCGEAELKLPGTEWSEAQQAYVDDTIHTIRTPQINLRLTHSYRSRELYEVNLELGLPAQADTAEHLVKQLAWYVRPVHAQGDEAKQVLEWKDGALRTTVQGKEVCLTPKGTESQTLHLSDGSHKTGINQLSLEANTAGLELELGVQGVYAGIIALPDGVHPIKTADTTSLCPDKPYIYTDVSANHMQMRGSTTMRCRYGRVSGGQIRVWKLRSDGEHAVRMLEEYGKLYMGTHLNWQDEQERKQKRKEAGLDVKNFNSHRLNTQELIGIEAMAQRELPGTLEGELQLPLKEVFPNQPVGGFYLVEVEGTPLRESKNPCINQGLVQVTDLGLLWKTNGKEIFAWAYHLSTAGAVKSARLKMLDSAGDTLAELPVSQGLAQGAFPAATRYLQLCTGDDCVTMPHKAHELDYTVHQGDTWTDARLIEAGINPGDVPRPEVFIFSDRSLYRPGETAYVKGIIRWICGNKVVVPQVSEITANLELNYDTIAQIPVSVQADGAFSAEVPFRSVGRHRLQFNITYRGDEDETSPDYAALKGSKAAEVYHYDREASINLACKEFRRNEFEIESRLQADAARRTLSMEATATHFTGNPVSGGEVQWTLQTRRHYFCPTQAQWADYSFGDYRENPWARYMVLCGQDPGEDEHTGLFSQSGHLDAAGKGSTTFVLPEAKEPIALRAVMTATITNGNEQSLRSVQDTILHPAGVYVGIKSQGALARIGGTLPVELVAVRPNGEAWDGAPLAAEVIVKRSVFHPYRYGSFFSSSMRNTKEETIVCRMPVSVSGTPGKVEVPLSDAGIYDIIVQGRDSDNLPFHSATRHHVWGDEESPWAYLNGTTLSLLPDKPLYKPGETAKVLVQTPVDAELLVTIERERVLRHMRCSITVDKPVIEVPLEGADAPEVHVSVSLVQNAGGREADGKPLLKMGTCSLKVEAAEKRLQVQLNTPRQSILPTDDCTVSGLITDAAGNPVANADVTLYAEDEGTLQVMGYKLPDPMSCFYSSREHSVGSYSAQGLLVSENLGARFFGNKGVFIGGGDDEMEEDELNDKATQHLRRNFNPCALWLASVRTDAQGRFSTHYRNPDTLTRYRVMAIAAAGDKFGSAESSYRVITPVMLEPTAPMSATAGDELQLPVTLSMAADELTEAANQQAVTWTIRLSGENAELPVPTQNVTLQGNQPVTVYFPVKIPAAGNTVLRWQVQAANAPQGSMLARCRDAVELQFQAVPPTPYHRETFTGELAPGVKWMLRQWIKGQFRPESNIKLTFSTSPLAGIEYPMQYLFSYPYGCSEQICSKVIPWIFRDHLQNALGVKFPQEKDLQAILAEADARLQERRLPQGGYGYWKYSTEPSEFSPYVVLVRALMNTASSYDVAFLRRCVAEDKCNPYLSLFVLGMMEKMQLNDLNTMLRRAKQQRKALSAQECWLLALCAHMQKHPDTAALVQQAQKSPVNTDDAHLLPPLQALQCMWAIETEPHAPATTKMVRSYLLRQMGLHSTWRNAWMVLVVELYNISTGAADKTAKLNGEELSAANPLHQELTVAQNRTKYQATQATVYAYGRAEGYLVNKQPKHAVDCGFAVQRRYEQLQPDGSWKSTASFRVGDVVRVTLTARATCNEPILRYLAVEDPLPACMEVVDPELASQALPEGISEAQSLGWWSFSAPISNREFLKDRVRIFANSLNPGDKLEISYVARVTRSGKVTAPGTRTELMYQPEIYGLSAPQQFEVSAR